MKSFKKFLMLAAGLILAIAMTACGSGSGGNSADTPANDASDASSEEAKGLKVAIVTSSGVDDGSFGQGCYNGIQSFIATHPGSTVNAVKEPDMGKLIDATRDILADYDAVVLPGYQFAPIGVTALENPDKYFIIVDANPTNADGAEEVMSNVYGMTFKEQESGFFAGIAAALETQTGKVAVVTGMAFPSNVNYQFGFMAGVNYANAHFGSAAQIVELPSYAGVDVRGVDVGGNYIGGFADQATGKVVGQALIAEGVDIMFVAAGDSGNGVFAAAKEASGTVYTIGCDVDQYDDGDAGSRNIILTSVLKVMDINVEKQLDAIASGTFSGTNAVLGADSGSTGFVSTEGRHQMSEETVKRMNEAFDLVKNGTIVPPSNFSEDATTDSFPGL